MMHTSLDFLQFLRLCPKYTRRACILELILLISIALSQSAFAQEIPALPVEIPAFEEQYSRGAGIPGVLCIPAAACVSSAPEPDVYTLFMPFIEKWTTAEPAFDLVLVGKEGWLYYTGDRSIEDYQGLEQLSQLALERIDANLSKIKRQLEGQGILFQIVFAPDKQTIYPEYLPEDIQKLQPGTRLDQILAYNQGHAQVPVLDLRAEMLMRKQTEVIYYRTDSHWNNLGAYYAYSRIMQALMPRFPVLEPHPISAFTITKRQVQGLELAELIWMEDDLTDEMVTLSPHFERRAVTAEVPFPPADSYLTFASQVDDPSLPTAVIFRDSTSTALVPFLEEHFRRAVFVWSRRIDFDLIAHEQPDIVILVVVERKAGSLDQ